MCHDAHMSSNAGGPNGPNVPPPPGQGPGGSYDGYPQQGQPPAYGAPQGPGQPNPYGATPGQPEKKSKKNLLIGLVVGTVLLLLLCGGGALLLFRGDDNETTSTTSSSTMTSSSTTSETSEPSSSTSETSSETSEPTSETSSEAAGGGVTLPEEFDGWKKVNVNVDAPAGSQVAAYSKGGEGFSIVVMDDMPGIMDEFESLWSNEQSVGDARCGSYTGQTQCAKVVDDKVFLATHGGDVDTTGGLLETFLDSL